MKYVTLTVVLTENLNDEGVIATMDAIKMIRNVHAVTANPVDHDTQYATEVRVRGELTKKLFEALK
jgi:hypothetical protein